MEMKTNMAVRFAWNNRFNHSELATTSIIAEEWEKLSGIISLEKESELFYQFLVSIKK